MSNCTVIANIIVANHSVGILSAMRTKVKNKCQQECFDYGMASRMALLMVADRYDNNVITNYYIRCYSALARRCLFVDIPRSLTQMISALLLDTWSLPEEPKYRRMAILEQKRIARGTDSG